MFWKLHTFFIGNTAIPVQSGELYHDMFMLYYANDFQPTWKENGHYMYVYIYMYVCVCQNGLGSTPKTEGSEIGAQFYHVYGNAVFSVHHILYIIFIHTLFKSMLTRSTQKVA